MLEQINSPEDLKKLTLKQKEELAQEIREYILDVVSKNGGHLASNLGVVELTIAIHSIFNVPDDKIIWDVGHQSYVHKILTGRKEELKNIRKLNGIAGFPKTNESEADCFNTGHSSTSISAALGMARARDLEGKNNSVVAVIGDGALTGGMALEALNDAGFSKCKMTVILNDNEILLVIIDFFIEINDDIYENDLVSRRLDFKKIGDLTVLRKLDPFYEEEEIMYAKILEKRYPN